MNVQNFSPTQIDADPFFNIAEKSEMIKLKLDKTNAKLQFAKAIFSFFSNIYKEINSEILKNFYESISEIAIQNSDDYKLIRKVFKKFKQTFAKELRFILSQEDIKALANPENCDWFIKKYGSFNPKLIGFYNDFFLKFIAAIQQEPRRKKMRIDWLCNPTSPATISDDQMFAAFKPQEEEKEKEKEREIDLPQKMGSVDPQTYVKTAELISLNLLVKSIALNGELLSVTSSGKLHYWNSNFPPEPLNPRFHTPIDCKNLSVNANESFALCVGDESKIALFGSSPSGTSLSFVERKPIQHNFNFFSAITAASLYGNIMGFGFQDGSLQVFDLNKNSYETPIFKITKPLRATEIKFDEITTLHIDPFGTNRINTLSIEKGDLIVGGGGFRTAVLTKIGMNPEPLIFRGYATMVRAARLMEDNSFLTGSKSKEIIVWDLTNLKPKFSLLHQSIIEGDLLDLAPDRQGFYALYKGSENVYYYDIRSKNNPVWRISQNKNPITSMAFDIDSSELYLTSQNQIMTKWRGKKTLVQESEITSGEPNKRD